MIESYDPQTRAWAEREQADEERRRLERTEREGAPGPSCPDCGLPMARVAGPDGHGWTCVNCNAAGDPEGDHLDAPPDPDADIDWAESARNQLQGMREQAARESAYEAARAAEDEDEPPSDPDADRPCNCDQALALERRAITAESRANALALKLQASEAECRERLARNQELSAALCKAEAHVRELEDRLAITENSRNSNHEKRLIAESEARALRDQLSRETVDVLFDGPPSHESGRFVECEDGQGKSIRAGEWSQRGEYWVLSIPTHAADARALRERIERAISILTPRGPQMDSDDIFDDSQRALEALRGK